jgi:hypothetical protein
MGFQKRFIRSNAHISNNDTPRVSGSVVGPGRSQQRGNSQTPQQQHNDNILKTPMNLSLRNPLEKDSINSMSPLSPIASAQPASGFRSIGKKKF